MLAGFGAALPRSMLRRASTHGLLRLPGAPGVLAHAGLWSVLAFVLNLAWEMAHVRLYTVWEESSGVIARALLHCTLGDVLIALAMFALAGIALWRADWPTSRPWTGGAIVVIGATAFTAWSEWYNVYRAGNWGYAAGMPLIFGIGLSPLLQWIILPAAMVGAFRALGPVLFGTQTSGESLSTHRRTKGPT